jgi:hypothetical protein
MVMLGKNLYNIFSLFPLKRKSTIREFVTEYSFAKILIHPKKPHLFGTGSFHIVPHFDKCSAKVLLL